MSEKYLGNAPEAALQIVETLFPSANMRIINDGQENLIVVVDETQIVRFPRTEEVWQNGRNERFVLKKLSPMLEMPIPRLIDISEDPAYVITTYQKGNQLTTRKMRTLPLTTLRHIGEEIATFAFTLHATVASDEIQPFLIAPTWSYDDYLKRVLLDRQDPNPKVDELAKHYYHAWLRKEKKKEVVVHDDLHTGNLLFNDTYHLAGVLDFGAICLGTPEQELRQVYRLGDEALGAAAVVYEKLSSRPVDRELAKLWTITQELGSYCRPDTKAVHDRAAENLRFWFPDLDI